MKKLLALVLAMSAVFCFAACEDGKCDECGRKADDVKVYEDLDDQELCPECAAEEFKDALEDELGDIGDEIGDLFG